MYLNNYQHLKNKETFLFIFLILFSVLIRIPTIILFGDVSLENEWKILVDNLILHGTLSFRNFDGFLLPNLYMPPLYAYYLYLFSMFNFQEQNYIQLILASQILLSSISVVIFYKINKFFFSKKISFYSSILFSIFPVHVYACGQISSISLQIFLTILFFFYFFQLTKKRTIFSILFFSITGGLLMLLRGEFSIIIFFSLIYLNVFYKIPIKKIVLITLIITMTIFPYLVRNINIFETVTITKTLGYNLWKGNNANSTVEGSEFIGNNLQKKINQIPKDKFYQINFDKVFFDQAILNISEQPTRYIILYIKKFFSLLFIDFNSSQPNYYNPLHYIPLFMLGITSLAGLFVSNKKSISFNYLILIFFIYVFLFSSFFILPRYYLVILPLKIIFTNSFAEYLIQKFFKSYEQAR